MSGTLVLASGGVESSVLLHHIAGLGGPVLPVYARQGFRWERIEALWLERFLDATHREEFLPLEMLVLPLADLYPKDHFGLGGRAPGADAPDEECCLPGRNVTILAKAGVLAASLGMGTIALGALSGNPFPDATAGFFGRMSAILSESLEHPVEVTAPFLGLTKPEVLRMGAGLPLATTFSCMDPAGELHCGVCAKCEERRRGFLNAGLEDGTEYA